MSYAAANQDSENQYDLSESFLETTGKQLNDSLDNIERLLPDNRAKNRHDVLHLRDAFYEMVTNENGYFAKHAHDMRIQDTESVNNFTYFCDIVMVAEL